MRLKSSVEIWDSVYREKAKVFVVGENGDFSWFVVCVLMVAVVAMGWWLRCWRSRWRMTNTRQRMVDGVKCKGLAVAGDGCWAGALSDGGLGPRVGVSVVVGGRCGDGVWGLTVMMSGEDLCIQIDQERKDCNFFLSDWV